MCVKKEGDKERGEKRRSESEEKKEKNEMEKIDKVSRKRRVHREGRRETRGKVRTIYTERNLQSGEKRASEWREERVGAKQEDKGVRAGEKDQKGPEEEG